MTRNDSTHDSVVFPVLMGMTHMTQPKPDFGEGKTSPDGCESCESSESGGDHVH